MLSTLKAEFKKLLTTRSTYIVALLGLLFIIFIAFYVQGYRQLAGPPDSRTLIMLVAFVSSIVAPLAAIVSVLFIIHEYRYNTLMYSLTITNSRTKFLLSKIIVSAVYALSFFLLALGVAIVAFYAGEALSNASLPMPVQDISWTATMWRNVFYVLGVSLSGLLFAVLFRNIVAALVMIFVFPNTVEPLLGLILKENVKYLPFSALSRVGLPDQITGMGPGQLSSVSAAIVFSAYMAVGWLIAWYLFVRRDAN